MRRLFSIRFMFVVFGTFALCAASFAQISIGVSVAFGPPELPVYEQPLCPGDGYIWTPGYWAWDGYDYYWVPGTWVLAPEPGFFWTPAWWGWGGHGYIFHAGYWGPRIGFYGGINYGYGYFGHGYEGGHWEGKRFFYNRTVNNVNVTEIHNVYNTTIVKNYGDSRISYNGGRGGIEARPTSEEESALHDRHIPPVTAQMQHVEASRNNRELRVSINHGKPPVAATSRPGNFTEPSVMHAKEGRGYGSDRPEKAAGFPGSAVHPKELPANSRMSSPSTGNAKQDRRFQQDRRSFIAGKLKNGYSFSRNRSRSISKLPSNSQTRRRCSNSNRSIASRRGRWRSTTISSRWKCSNISSNRESIRRRESPRSAITCRSLRGTEVTFGFLFGQHANFRWVAPEKFIEESRAGRDSAPLGKVLSI